MGPRSRIRDVSIRRAPPRMSGRDAQFVSCLVHGTDRHERHQADGAPASFGSRRSGVQIPLPDGESRCTDFRPSSVRLQGPGAESGSCVRRHRAESARPDGSEDAYPRSRAWSHLSRLACERGLAGCFPPHVSPPRSEGAGLLKLVDVDTGKQNWEIDWAFASVTSSRSGCSTTSTKTTRCTTRSTSTARAGS